MATKLPFIVAPTIRKQTVSATIDGQEATLEFPVFGALKGKEQIHIREHEYQGVVYRESSRLADALVVEGMEETEAQRTAIRIISTRMGIPVALDGPEQRVMLRHAPLVADLTAELADAFLQQRIRTVAALIIHRLPGCQDWTDDDAGNLPIPLQDAIYAFATAEQTASQPQRSPEELVEEMVDTLGKLGPATNPSPSTGQASTGDVADSGPMPQSSAASDSAISISATSLKPSKKASAG